MEPLQFFGLGGWTHRVGEALSQVDIPRYLSHHDAATHDKTKVYLAINYRRFWDACLADGQDMECLGREFKEIQAKHDAAMAYMRGRSS
jgi:hypothetical protein